MVGVGDWKGYITNPEGINPHKLGEWVAETGSVANYRGADSITREEFFSLNTDILIPAALELELGSDEAQACKARLVAEGANGPTHPTADRIFAERGIAVIPDILANSGGVVVSYFEWLQNKRAERWDHADVLARLERRMKRTYAQVRQCAIQRNMDWRTACYALGLERLQECYQERGIFP
jgi:glutamate dehydrogenase (NAD(P)+)